MFVGFQTLFRMGKFRIGAGFRVKKVYKCNFFFFTLCFIDVVFRYSFRVDYLRPCWLCFYLPYKGISKLIKNSKTAGRDEY